MLVLSARCCGRRWSEIWVLLGQMAIYMLGHAEVPASNYSARDIAGRMAVTPADAVQHVCSVPEGSGFKCQCFRG